MPRQSGSPEPLPGACGAKLRGVELYCKQPLAEGAKRCRRHGGGAPQVKAKEVERVEARKNEEIMRRALPFGESKDVDPLKALLKLISDKAQEVEWLRYRVEELGDRARIWGPSDHQEGIGPMGAVDMTTSKAGAHTWWVMLRTAEDQLAKFVTAALKAGVAERQVQLAEQQAAVMVGMVQRALASLTLPPDLLEAAHAAFAREFRAIEVAPSDER